MFTMTCHYVLSKSKPHTLDHRNFLMNIHITHVTSATNHNDVVFLSLAACIIQGSKPSFKLNQNK